MSPFNGGLLLGAQHLFAQFLELSVIPGPQTTSSVSSAATKGAESLSWSYWTSYNSLNVLRPLRLPELSSCSSLGLECSSPSSDCFLFVLADLGQLLLGELMGGKSWPVEHHRSLPPDRGRWQGRDGELHPFALAERTLGAQRVIFWK